MRITQNEIRKRLSRFALDWPDAKRERGEAQTFWLRFCECFDVRAESVSIYEKAIKKLGGNTQFIDRFIPGKLIVECKGRGKNLEAAFDQAADYFTALKEADRPRYILVCDFARFRLIDLRDDSIRECTLADLPKKAEWFRFLAEDNAPAPVEENPSTQGRPTDTMPATLRAAHNDLNKAVDAAYGYPAKSRSDDAARVAFLFARYNALIAPVEAETGKKRSASQQKAA